MSQWDPRKAFVLFMLDNDIIAEVSQFPAHTNRYASVMATGKNN